jgi:complement component 1 Q subcomponent-binding protein
LVIGACSELDKNLQETFHKYLELRGITPTATKLLHEYMISKDRRVLPKTASKDTRNNLVFLTKLHSFLKKD